MTIPTNPFTLAHWRRTMAELYAAARHTAAHDSLAAWQQWRAGRDDLFKNHPQSPLDPNQKQVFTALDFYPYDLAWRVAGELKANIERETFHVQLPDEGDLHMTRVAYVHFAFQSTSLQLSLFWLEGYGGGLFLPFKDLTNGGQTYGGGRYLYDSIKGADLGMVGDALAATARLVLDFNYAYNPSCAYNPGWVCPLAPAENRLPLPVEAGERAWDPAPGP